MYLRLNLAAVSLTSAANCLEFCSNVLAVFTPMFDICLEMSFVCCSAGFHASRVEKITLFESLIADTVLSATVLTNVVYALTAVIRSTEVGNKSIKGFIVWPPGYESYD